MVALIDADILCYRIGFACQKTRYTAASIDLGTKKVEAKRLAVEAGFKVGDIESQLEVDPIEHCLHSVKVAMTAIIKETKADSYRAFLTGKGNFREELVDYYKMNRKDSAKPFYYQQIRDYLVEHWNAEIQEGQEADDILSIVQYEDIRASKYYDPTNGFYPGGRDCNTVIVTIDKDLKNSMGWNYNFVKKEMTFITQEQADLNFYGQLIQGDMTDNIPGLYQITGTKALAKYFEPLAYCETVEQMWEHVVDTYQNQFANWADNLKEAEDIHTAVVEKLKETGILLWMRRFENEIWEPPHAE